MKVWRFLCKYDVYYAHCINNVKAIHTSYARNSMQPGSVMARVYLYTAMATTNLGQCHLNFCVWRIIVERAFLWRRCKQTYLAALARVYIQCIRGRIGDFPEWISRCCTGFISGYILKIPLPSTSSSFCDTSTPTWIKYAALSWQNDWCIIPWIMSNFPYFTLTFFLHFPSFSSAVIGIIFK